ncbi:MAG: serine hydrolase [Candidatus Hodarchaeales archaeon]|jgi:WD40 repeat protein
MIKLIRTNIILTIGIMIILIPMLNVRNQVSIETNETYLSSFDDKNIRINSLISNNKFTNFADLTGHGWRVREVIFSPLDHIIASGSSDGSIHLWNLTDGKVLHTLSRHHYGVIALDFSPSGKILASGGIDNKINLWNVTSGEHLKTWSLYPHGIIDLKWSPDGNSMVIGGGEWMVDDKIGNQQDKLLQIMNVTTGKVIKSLVGHTDAVHSVAFSKDGSKIISGSWDKTIKLWNTSNGTEIRSFGNHTDKVTSITFSNDETTIISGSLDGTVKTWDVNTGNMIREMDLNQSIWSIALSPIDSSLAVAVDPSLTWPNRYWLTFGDKTHDCSIQLWNIEDGTKVDTLIGHKNTIESVKFSNDGTILASASWDWIVKLWGDQSQLIVDKPIDEWPISSLEEQGINSTMLLIDRLNYLNDLSRHNLHSLLVIRHGKLVHEEYFTGDTYNYTRESKHTLFSATKSFTSALIGIAIDKGFIENVEEKVLDFFPEKTFENVDSRKKAMTVHHLLTMTTGLLWNDMSDDFWEMAIANDSVEYILSKPMFLDPGSMYNYNSGASQILSAIIQKTTGLTTQDFAMKFLFDPLGIEEQDVIWVSGSDGVFHGGVGLFLTPRNMAKLGQLYLNNGEWDGNQILSSDWVKESSHDHVAVGDLRTEINTPAGYGYHFWIGSDSVLGDFYFALGWGGQTIQIFPEYDLVIVTTANQDTTNALGVSYDVIDSITDSSQTSSWTVLPVVITLASVSQILRRKKKKSV